MPTVKDESSDDVLDFTKPLFKEAKVAVLDIVLDRAYRIGPSYMDTITNKKCKSIIVRFTTFRQRILFYSARKNLKIGFKGKLGFTKCRLNLLKKVNDYVKEILTIRSCYANVNCLLKVKFHDVNQEDIFFSTFNKLHGSDRLKLLSRKSWSLHLKYAVL